MKMQIEHHHPGFFEQLMLIGAVTIVLLVLAWSYIG
jgi:hypothetical protein